MDRILTSIKKLLSIPEDNTEFDVDITIHINTAFAVLSQLGVGPEEGFTVPIDDTKVWTDFIEQSPTLEMVKNYIYFKVRTLFDPPTTSTHADATKNALEELEFRIKMQAEHEVANNE